MSCLREGGWVFDTHLDPLRITPSSLRYKPQPFGIYTSEGLGLYQTCKFEARTADEKLEKGQGLK